MVKFARKSMFKYVFLIVVVAVVFACTSLFQTNISVVEASDDLTFFTGCDSLDYSTKKELVKYASGTGGAPVLTILTPGIREDAYTWSGDLLRGFVYDSSSLPEQIRESYSNVEVFVASYINNGDGIEFVLKKQNVSDYNNKWNGTSNAIEKLESSDINKHIVVMFQVADPNETYANQQMGLEKVINLILCDYLYLGAHNPTVNLIGHGAGGLLNIAYANEYPNTVKSIYNIGTPHHGADTLPLLKTLRQFGVPLGDRVETILNNNMTSKILEGSWLSNLNSEWNNTTLVQNPHIDAYAVSTVIAEDHLFALAEIANGIQELLGAPPIELSQLLDTLVVEATFIGKYFGENVKNLVLLMNKIKNEKSVCDALNQFTDEDFEQAKKFFNFNVKLNDSDDPIDLNLFSAQIGMTALKGYHNNYLSDSSYLSFDKYLLDKGTVYLNSSNFEINFYSIYEELKVFFSEKILFGDCKENNQIVSNSVTLIEYVATNSEILKDFFLDMDTLISSGSLQKLEAIAKATGYTMSFLPTGVAISPLILMQPFCLSLVATLGISLAIFDNQYDHVFLQFLNDVKLKSNTEFSDSFWDFLFFNNSLLFMSDLIVQYDSQRAQNYNGFKRYSKIYTAEEMNINKTSNIKLPIPIAHFLQTKDEDVIRYIMKSIDISLPDTMFTFKKVTGGYEITGLNQLYTNQNIINVPQTFNGENIVSIGKNAFEKARSYVHTIILPETLKRIGYGAFRDFSQLTTINMPQELEYIGMFAFSNIPINSLILPSSIMTVDKGVFVGSHILLSISDNSRYKTINGSLYEQLHDDTTMILYAYMAGSHFEMPDDVSTIAPYAFSYSSITNVDINNIEFIGDYAFAWSDLTTITGGAQVKDIGINAFFDTGLSSSAGEFLVLGNILLRYSGVATKLYESDFPANVEIIYENAFANTNVEYVETPYSVTIISSRAFADSASLKSVVINQLVRFMGEAIFLNTEIDEIIFLEAIPKTYRAMYIGFIQLLLVI